MPNDLPHNERASAAAVDGLPPRIQTFSDQGPSPEPYWTWYRPFGILAVTFAMILAMIPLMTILLPILVIATAIRHCYNKAAELDSSARTCDLSMTKDHDMIAAWIVALSKWQPTALSAMIFGRQHALPLKHRNCTKQQRLSIETWLVDIETTLTRWWQMSMIEMFFGKQHVPPTQVFETMGIRKSLNDVSLGMELTHNWSMQGWGSLSTSHVGEQSQRHGHSNAIDKGMKTLSKCGARTCGATVLQDISSKWSKCAFGLSESNCLKPKSTSIPQSLLLTSSRVIYFNLVPAAAASQVL